ncbi:hypothetical protein RirG_024110 [Rhizophagus irregularis DAOM 197198w]|uniref:Uncharacterized protein n=1 Tax=Rhizophagus irregularis (strain DAOM 197198w) TaxID=1432141 RepID=A0A015LCG3_RHIIW|nr:hypothetical protein RirG_024110 [Rhizophagus irregularis DAOM 197198w]
MEGTLFSSDNCKSNTTGEGEGAKVEGKELVIKTLRLIQFSFLIPISPLLVKDWTLWSKLLAFKQDYIACTIALLTTTPFQLSRS